MYKKKTAVKKMTAVRREIYKKYMKNEKEAFLTEGSAVTLAAAILTLYVKTLLTVPFDVYMITHFS